eukprot:jgi/Botrbrau1/4621/Bobra.60_2s0104.1
MRHGLWEAQGLVNEVTAFLSVLEASHPLASRPQCRNAWSGETDDAQEHFPDWSTVVDELDLSVEQLLRLLQLHQETQEQETPTFEGEETVSMSWLSGLVGKQRQPQVVTTSRNRAALWEEILRKILTPLQAALVYVACTPQAPCMQSLLDAVKLRHVRDNGGRPRIGQVPMQKFARAPLPRGSTGEVSRAPSAGSKLLFLCVSTVNRPSL